MWGGLLTEYHAYLYVWSTRQNGYPQGPLQLCFASLESRVWDCCRTHDGKFTCLRYFIMADSITEKVHCSCKWPYKYKVACSWHRVGAANPCHVNIAYNLIQTNISRPPKPSLVFILKELNAAGGVVWSTSAWMGIGRLTVDFKYWWRLILSSTARLYVRNKEAVQEYTIQALDEQKGHGYV